MRLHGFDEQDKRYLTFVEARSDSCGDAFYPIWPGTAPMNGQYADVYLLSPPRCRPASFGRPGAPSFAESTALQELIHNEALVSIGAPHTCQPDLFSHICTGPLYLNETARDLDPERIDVMFPVTVSPLSEEVLDRGNDDYFEHPFPHLRDLANSLFLERRK